MNTAKKYAEHAFNQFELTNYLLNNLSQFDITATAKLVLVELSLYYNPAHADVFPKQRTLAKKIGISERSVVRAIQELVNAGLIIIEYKYANRYKFTNKIIETENINETNETNETNEIGYGQNVTTPGDNLSHTTGQNVTQQGDNLSPSLYEQIKEQKKQPIKVEDFKILKDYAVQHGAKNVKAYVAALKANGSAPRIVEEYRNKIKAQNRAANAIKETQKHLAEYRNIRLGIGCSAPESCKEWVELREKLIKRPLQ